jgi:hypothetical protein
VAAGVNSEVVVAVLSTDAGDPMMVPTPPEPRAEGDLVGSAVGDPARINSEVIEAVLSTDAGDPMMVPTPPEPRVDEDLVGSAVRDPVAAAKSSKGSMETLRALPTFGVPVEHHPSFCWA